MGVIIDSGNARNLTNAVLGEHLVPDATERRFVTYTNDLGAVHTVVVDADHPAPDPDALLAWFDHTRAIVAVLSGPEGTPSHIPPEQVRALAAERIGATPPADQPEHGEQV